MRWTLGITGDLLVTAGALLLLFVGWQLWWTDVTANRAQSATVDTLTRDFTATPPATTPPTTEKPTPVAFGQAFAIIRVPRFGADYARPVLQGTSLDILQGRVYSPPYVITAIGDRDRMEQSLRDDEAVGLFRQAADLLGLGYDVSRRDAETFPAYTGSLTLEDAEAAR